MRHSRTLDAFFAATILLAGLTVTSPALATSVDAYETDNTAAAAKTATLGSIQQRSIYPAGDVDWIEFTAIAGTTYRLETARATLTPDANTSLELYAADATTLLASDYENTGRGNFSRIVWTAPSSGTYYLRVTGWTASLSGNYALKILDTTGLRYIRGTVTDEDGGAPLAGIWVGASSESGDLVGRTRTEANGTYAVPLFYDDSYIVQFDDTSDVYIGEYYDDAAGFGDRTLVAVGASGVTGIDAGLALGAEITGTVTDEKTDAPVAGISVYLHIADGTGSVIWIKEATTAADGSYRFGGLLPDDYAVAFHDAAEHYVAEYYDGTRWTWPFQYDSTTFDDAVWLGPAAGEAITGIDASMLPRPAVSGRIVDESGDPIEDVQVTVVAGTAPQFIGETLSAADGTWTVYANEPGDYRIEFAPGLDFVREYYDDVRFSEGSSATLVGLGDYGTTTSGIDATLTAAGKITGTFTSGGDPVPFARVYVYEKIGDEFRYFAAPSDHDSAGNYTVGGLPSGDFYLEFSGDYTQVECSGNAPSLRFSTPVSVTAPLTTSGVNADLVIDPYRAAGADRYATGVAASKATFGVGQCDTVVLASGADFADAVSASGLAGSVKGPVLIVKPDSAPQVVLDEIERLGATNAYVVGGTAAIQDAVLDAVDALSGMAAPTRISGATRYETSANVAQEIADIEGADFSRAAFVARGDLFPDALAAGPFAYSRRMPVLLVKPDSLPAAIASTIESLDITSTVICGDATAVSADVEDTIQDLNAAQTTTLRRGGSTRFSTATSIATYGIEQGWCRPSRPSFGYATGYNFPDALTGASTLGAREGCLLLVKPTALPDATATFLDAYKNYEPRTIILGGTSVVSPEVIQAIEAAIIPYIS